MTASLRELLIWLVVWLLPVMALTVVSQVFLWLPARRQERARLFLDLLQTAIQTGKSPERVIVEISEARERSVSPYFHLLAAHIEEGATLSEALEKTPGLLPPNVSETIRIGVDQSTVPNLIPAARAMLSDCESRLRGAVNYVILFVVVLVPAITFFLPFLTIYVWPKLQAVILDFEIMPPPFSRFIFENAAWFSLIEFAFAVGILFFAFFYVGGPGISRFFNRITGGLVDRLALWIPWRRKRIHRDFTGALAALLDAGLNEPRAIELAARATANEIFQSRAAEACARLNAGIALPEAIKALESNGEFQWRWANALRAGKGFFECLRGWHETLEARAFQQEQAAAHVITTGLVIFNGAMVGVITSAVFLLFISLIEEGSLW